MSQKTGIRYTLRNGSVLQVCDDEVELFDVDRNKVQINLSVDKRKFLYKLLDELGHTVNYRDLYFAYSGDSYYDASDSSKVQGMKYGLDPLIRDCIDTDRGYGYSLNVLDKETVTIDTSLSAISTASLSVADNHVIIPSASTHSRITELVGDYYGFYLDRLGSGRLFGVYMHVENRGNLQEPDIVVHAVLGVRTSTVLFGDPIGEIFAVPQNDYSDKFALFREQLNSKDRECFLGKGKIVQHKAIIEITFDAVTDENWHIFVDLQGYFADPREKRNDTDFYRGGLGLAFAFWSEFGDTCFRFAFVRRSLRTPSISLQNTSIRDKLKITADGQGTKWNPIKLSSRMDKAWYNWFMKEYQDYRFLSAPTQESTQA